MLGLLFIIIAGVIGARTEKLGWKPFAGIAVFIVMLIPIQIALKSSAIERLGETTSGYWEPSALIGNWAVNFAIYSVSFLIGFGIGKWRRGKK